MKILRPSPGKLFANADETELYSALILAPSDSLDNYHEVDELTEPVEPSGEEPTQEEEPFDDSEIIIIPDEEGKISYEDAQRLLDRLAQITRRVISLSESQVTDEQISLATRYESL